MIARLSSEISKHSNRLDLVAQLVEHWTSKPKVAGSIPTVVRLIFQLAWCGIYTQSNNTLYIFSLSLKNDRIRWREFISKPYVSSFFTEASGTENQKPYSYMSVDRTDTIITYMYVNVKLANFPGAVLNSIVHGNYN